MCIMHVCIRKKRRVSRRLDPGTSTPRLVAPFKVGDTVQGQWRIDDDHKGEWYSGQIKSIDLDQSTIHILFEDGDEDKSLPWSQVTIID